LTPERCGQWRGNLIVAAAYLAFGLITVGLLWFTIRLCAGR
jgi:hypothetical protein